MTATLQRLARGEAGSIQTLGVMSDLIVAGARDPSVRERYYEITRDLPERDVRAATEAVVEWVRGNVRYQWDPWDVEVITSPARLLAEAARGKAHEDCDGWVVLVASLLRAGGIPVHVKAIQGRADSGELDHVYLLVGDPRSGRWIPVDPIQRDKPVGWEPPTYVRFVVYDPAARKITARGRGPTPAAAPGFRRGRALSGFGAFSSPGVAAGASGRIPGYAAMSRGFGEVAFVYGQPETYPPGWTVAACTPSETMAQCLARYKAERAVRETPGYYTPGLVSGRALIIEERERLAASPTRLASLTAETLTAIDAQLAQVNGYMIEISGLLVKFQPILDALTVEAQRAGHRIRELLHQMQVVNTVAGIAATLVEFIPYVGTILAIAIQAANIGYQYRSMGRAMQGSSARTIQRIGGELYEMGSTMILASEVVVELEKTARLLVDARAELGGEPEDIVQEPASYPGKGLGPAARSGGVLPLLAMLALRMVAR